MKKYRPVSQLKATLKDLSLVEQLKTAHKTHEEHRATIARCQRELMYMQERYRTAVSLQAQANAALYSLIDKLPQYNGVPR